jgi:hypothetical protein
MPVLPPGADYCAAVEAAGKGALVRYVLSKRQMAQDVDEMGYGSALAILEQVGRQGW